MSHDDASSELDADEPPPRLAEVLDEAARRLLRDACSDLGLAVHVCDADGKPLVGQPVPTEIARHAEVALRVVNRFTDPPGHVGAPGPRWLVRRILVERSPIGLLAIGPFPADEEPAARRLGGYLSRMTDHLVASGVEHVAIHRAHSASIEQAYDELRHKNARLAAAVARLEELDKVKSNFLATVSHELRTPLTSVIGYSEMLLEGLAGPLNDEQREYVRTVMEKGEQLLAIITGILDISRIEAGAMRLDRSEFLLEDVIEAAVTTVLPTVRRKKLTVEKLLPSGLPRVAGDRDKIRQVLINLVGNAVKFTPEGGEVRVAAEIAPLRRQLAPCETAAAGDERFGIRVVVSDSGIGIPPDAVGKIFEPFFQVDASSTRQFGGTGLGLAIVRSFVHAHGGSVWVESQPGQGSRFYVTLPVA